MADIFENLIAGSLAGGISGSIEQFLAEEAAKKKMIAATWGKGKGAIPTEALAGFMRAGYGTPEPLEETPYDYMLSKPPPDVPTQLSALMEGGRPDFRPGPMKEGYVSVESPGVTKERKLKHKMVSQIPKDPGTQMYTYLRNVLDWNEEDSRRATEMAVPDVKWRYNEQLKQLRSKERTGVHQVWDSGDANKNNFLQVLNFHGILLSVEEKYLTMDEIREKLGGSKKSTRDLLYDFWHLTGDPNGPQHTLDELEQIEPYLYFMGNLLIEPDFAPRLWNEEFLDDIQFLPAEIQKRLIGTELLKPDYYKKQFDKWKKVQGIPGEISPADNTEYAMRFADTFTDPVERQAVIYNLTGGWPLEWGEERKGEELPPKYMGGVELPSVPKRLRTEEPEMDMLEAEVANLRKEIEALRGR